MSPNEIQWVYDQVKPYYFYLSGEPRDVSALLNLEPDHAVHHLLFLLLLHFQQNQ